jgi:hypothetical protein
MMKLLVLSLLLLLPVLACTPSVPVKQSRLVFVNEKPVAGDVFSNPYACATDENCMSIHYSFVNLKNVFEAIGSQVQIDGEEVLVSGIRTGDIQIRFVTQDSQFIRSSLCEAKDSFCSNDALDQRKETRITKIDSVYYIRLSTLRYLIHGAVSPFSQNISIYTRDHPRTDIPATLEDCYKALDTILPPEARDELKHMKPEDLINTHFGLGMTIRNARIYPDTNRIWSTLKAAGYSHEDDMSHAIIEGYFNYLRSEAN